MSQETEEELNEEEILEDEEVLARQENNPPQSEEQEIAQNLWDEEESPLLCRMIQTKIVILRTNLFRQSLPVKKKGFLHERLDQYSILVIVSREKDF